MSAVYRPSRETIFQVSCPTCFGAEVRVVGSSESLGHWDPTRGFRLETTSKLHPTWRSRSAVCLEECEIEYKYVIIKRSDPTGQVKCEWENGENRLLPAVQHSKEEFCQGVLVQDVFGDLRHRIFQLRAFPDRRAWSHLRKRGWWNTSLRSDGGHYNPRGCCHEAPTWTSDASKDDTADCGSLSGMTRASSTESLSLLEDSPEGQERRTLLVWPHGVFASGASMSVEVYGSFTQPPWEVPLTLHLCPETGVSWLALEEALPSLHPGTYEFKFVLDGETWTTNPALPICRNTPYGPGVVVENNFLRIDYRLLNCIERRMPSGTCPQRAEKSKQLSADALDGSCDASSEVLDEDALFDEACERVNAHGRAVSGLPSIGSRRGTVDAWSSNLDESSSDKALEEKMHGVVVAPRRNQSSADRLNTSSLHGNVPFSKKVQSLPDILERAKVSGDLFGICDLLGSSGDNAGTLYDNDVTLLLELPDCKRSVGLSLTAEAWYKPKRGKGEDSYFVSPPVLGVADGVGGLQTALGYTSKAFADELMAKCMAAAKQKLLEDISRDVLPSEFCRKVLCEGFHDMKSYGATTGVVTYFDARSNRLGMAILGDSGVMVVRRPTHKNFDASHKQSMRNTRSYIVFKSPTQQHEFNYPYQLCRLPQELKKLLIKPPDTPEDCVTFDVEVEEGDLILAYSDGVEDNLHDSEVLELCDHCLSPYAAHVLGLPPKAVTPAGLVARALGSAAFLRASDPTAKTPFGEEARKHGWPAAWCRGGKEDDITCVAAWVQHVAETQE